MTRYFLLFLIVFINMINQAAAGFTIDTGRHQNRSTGFSKVTIEGMVRVVLVESNGSNEISIEGRPALRDMVEILENEQEVVIRTKKNRSFIHNLTVYIPVSRLHTVNIKAHADVSSPGLLLSSLLNVYINGDCSVSLKVLGRINIIEGENFFFVPTGNYERNANKDLISPELFQTN